MYLLNSRAIFDCTKEDEYSKHEDEIMEVFEKLSLLNDYDCAVLRQRQDPAGSGEKTEILSYKSHDLGDIFEMADIKNGVDLLLDDTREFVVIVTYGQSYEMDGNSYIVTDAFKVLPYNNERDFLNIVRYVVSNKPVIKARNQFEETDTARTLLS